MDYIKIEEKADEKPKKKFDTSSSSSASDEFRLVKPAAK
jgi:hypothetical protein